MHGLDRSFASLMLVRALVQCLMTLRILPVLFAAVIPVACYSRSASSKMRHDIDGWKCWHGWYVVPHGPPLDWKRLVREKTDQNKNKKQHPAHTHKLNYGVAQLTDKMSRRTTTPTGLYVQMVVSCGLRGAGGT